MHLNQGGGNFTLLSVLTRVPVCAEGLGLGSLSPSTHPVSSCWISTQWSHYPWEVRKCIYKAHYFLHFRYKGCILHLGLNRIIQMKFHSQSASDSPQSRWHSRAKMASHGLRCGHSSLDSGSGSLGGSECVCWGLAGTCRGLQVFCLSSSPRVSRTSLPVAE